MRVIDLRSDTVTLPTPGMLQYMIQADIGDDGRARGTKGEDNAAAAAEKAVAEMFGKEDALYVPSGTMGNSVCIMTHCKRGDKAVTCQNMHMYKAEKVAFTEEWFGIKAVLVPQKKGCYVLEELKKALEENEVKLVCVENTYNFEGGTVLDRKEIEEILEISHAKGVPVHMDGARIFNASAALNMPVDKLCEGVDSVQFCVSKGLSAPIGSFITGSAEFIKKARIVRKQMGGQLRQVGLLAAAGQYAIENLSKRVVYDNTRARRLAEGIDGAKDISIDMDSVQTNIVKVDLHGQLKGRDWLKALEEEQSVRAHYITDDSVRLVTYRGITDEDITEAIGRIRSFCSMH